MPPIESILLLSLVRVDASFHPPALRSSILTSECNPHPLGGGQTCRKRPAHSHPSASSIRETELEETSSGDYDRDGKEGALAGEFLPQTLLTSVHFHPRAGSSGEPLGEPFASCRKPGPLLGGMPGMRKLPGRRFPATGVGPLGPVGWHRPLRRASPAQDRLKSGIVRRALAARTSAGCDALGAI